MTDKNNPCRNPDPQDTDSYDYLGKAAAGMDCTGLIPGAPQSPAELEFYEQLYPYLPPHTAEEDLSKACVQSDFARNSANTTDVSDQVSG